LPPPARRVTNSSWTIGAKPAHQEEKFMAADERIIVYEKPTCTTCRQLAQLLREAGVEYEAVDYLLDPIPRDELARLVGMMGISARELLRTREAAYRELGLGRADLTDDELLDAMAAHPELVQRPIIVRGERAVLARPAEKVREIL
jgi:arsenate reductase